MRRLYSGLDSPGLARMFCRSAATWYVPPTSSSRVADAAIRQPSGLPHRWRAQPRYVVDGRQRSRGQAATAGLYRAQVAADLALCRRRVTTMPAGTARRSAFVERVRRRLKSVRAPPCVGLGTRMPRALPGSCARDIAVASTGNRLPAMTTTGNGR